MKKNKLWENFAGQFVSILTNMQIEQTLSKGENVEFLKTPLSFKGYLLDACDTYYYLGTSPGFITQAIPVDQVAHMEITREEADLMEQLLVDGEIPSEEKFN